MSNVIILLLAELKLPLKKISTEVSKQPLLSCQHRLYSVTSLHSRATREACVVWHIRLQEGTSPCTNGQEGQFCGNNAPLWQFPQIQAFTMFGLFYVP